MTTRKKTTTKRTRTPISGARNILTAEVKDGYVGRWVNDIDDNVPRHVNAGYEFVTSNGDYLAGDESVQNAKSPTSGVISKNVGKGVTAYLMAQRKEWYEEDQAAKQAAITERERGILKGSGEGRIGEIKTDVTQGSLGHRVGKL